MKSYTSAEVSQHNHEKDLWIVINGDVWDLTKMIDMHPGGSNVLLEKGIAGQDASQAFFSLHRSEILTKYARFKIGTITDSTTAPYILPSAGALSTVPYAEPTWLSKGFVSPYYNDSHRALQKEMRYFFDTHVKHEARLRELSHEKPSKALVELMGTPRWNIHAMRMGPGKHLHGLVLPGGVKGEEFDYFHELVVVQELVRIGSPGYMAGLQAGMVIGLPPVLNFGSDALRAKILPDILAGKKFISLAISEAQAGSDVAGMTTWARKTPDGKHYIVQGAKKWITNGHFSDYFMTGVRTSEKGLSMLLIPRTEGVETKIIKTSYSHAAGTAYVSFDSVMVPVENLLGGEGQGLKVILSNFNHERGIICIRACRYMRVIYEETMIWVHLREVFGKKLVEQPVIRAKLAKMLVRVEAAQAWLETIIYQMTMMDYDTQSKKLAGPMALLKLYITRCATDIADDAVQIWGGRGITQGGMGIYIEQFQKTFKFDSILGGSEEVMADLGARQASKYMPLAVL